MNSWIESLNGFGDTWFHVVSSVVAQSVVVFALATIATKLLSKHSASLRFWVWQAAALKLMIVPFSMIIVLPLWPAAQTQEIAKATSHVVRRLMPIKCTPW